MGKAPEEAVRNGTQSTVEGLVLTWRGSPGSPRQGSRKENGEDELRDETGVIFANLRAGGGR